MNKLWSPEEIDLMKAEYGKTKLIALMGKFPGRSESSLRRMAKKLGLPAFQKPMKPWTDDETARLIEQYPHIKPSELVAKFPGRTKKNLIDKAASLGLTANKPHQISAPWTDAELSVLREHYPTEGMEGVGKRLPHRSNKAINLKAFYCDIKNDKTTSPWTTREIAILKRHYPHGGTKAVMSAMPNRNKLSILNKARRLGILGPRCKPWSKYEISLLKESYARGKPVHQIAFRLNRTDSSIRQKANAMKIRRTSE